MSIAFKDVVALTGAPGLYHIVKADDKAIVVESLDDKKKRQLVKGNMVVSKLVDVSIYAETDSEPLIHVLKAIQEKFGEELPVTKKSSKEELMAFLSEVMPNYDPERVYPSNVKKIISWYQVLLAFEIELELEEEEGEEMPSDSAATEDEEAENQES